MRINCPKCQLEIEIEKSVKVLVCSHCKEKIEIAKQDSLIMEVYYLFVKIGEWFKTNWRKIIIKFEGIVIRQFVVYESRCWNCKKPIKAVKEESKFKRWLGNKWLGNEKCPKPDCNYFLCSYCGMCLCDGPYSYKKSEKPFVKKWIKI